MPYQILPDPETEQLFIFIVENGKNVLIFELFTLEFSRMVSGFKKDIYFLSIIEVDYKDKVVVFMTSSEGFDEIKIHKFVYKD